MVIIVVTLRAFVVMQDWLIGAEVLGFKVARRSILPTHLSNKPSTMVYLRNLLIRPLPSFIKFFNSFFMSPELPCTP